MLLTDHQRHPCNFQRPWMSTFSWSQNEWELFFEINSQQVIEAFYYQGPADSPWLGYFSALSQLLPQHTVDQALCFSWAEFLPLLPNEDLVNLQLPWQNPVVTLLQSALKNYLGLDQLLAPVPGLLICRCLGITREEIISVVSSGTSNVAAITGKLKAGGACGTCLEDLQNILVEFDSRKRENWAKMVVEIDNWPPILLEQLTGISCQLEVLRLGLSGLDVKVHAPHSLDPKQEASLSRALQKQYPAILHINITY